MKKRLIVAIFILCGILCGCYLPPIGYEVPDRTFVRTESNVLTDGTVSFAPLPSGWQYTGEFPVCIGRVDNGGKVFASSEEEVLVQEESRIGASMDWREQLRTDVPLPDISADKCTAILQISGTSTELSEDMTALLCELYLLRNEKGVSDAGNALSILDYHKASAYLTFPSFPELRFFVGRIYYRKGYMLLECQREQETPGMVYIKIEKKSLLYEQILALIEE